MKNFLKSVVCFFGILFILIGLQVISIAQSLQQKVNYSFANSFFILNVYTQYHRSDGHTIGAHRDSMKIQNQYAGRARWQKLLKTVEYPALNGGKFFSVFPVSDISESPDAPMQYKLFYESKQRNPKSLKNEPDRNLAEVVKIMNMHVAAVVPLKNNSVVIVVHRGGNFAVMTNAGYRKRLDADNPNLKLVKALENAGAKFIICGQSMDFMGLARSNIFPEVKIAFSAQTTFTTYQLKEYVLKTMYGDT